MTSGAFQARVARGVYYARSVSASGLVDGHGTRVRVTGDIVGLSTPAVNEGTIGAFVTYQGKALVGGAVVLDGLTVPIDATGHFTAPAANRDFRPAKAITSPALGIGTPYVFGVPPTTFDGAPAVLDSTSIYGG